MITVDTSGAMSVRFYSVEEILNIQGKAVHRPASKTLVIWGVNLSGSPGVQDRCRLHLSEEEHARADRFGSAENRQRYIYAHGSLRVLLARYLNVRPAAIVFQQGASGKPALCADRHGRALSFSLSHAHGLALIAVAQEQEVGVDIERVRSDVEAVKLSERYFTSSEYARVMESREERRAAMFFRYWVAKEAVLKAQGIGLQALSQCEILLGADGDSAAVRVPPGSLLHGLWRVRFLSCGEGWEAAVSAEGVDWVVESGVIR